MVLSVDVKSSPISAVGDDNKMQDNLRQKWGDVCGAAQQSVGATAKTAAKNTSNKEKCGMPVLLCRDKIYSSFFFLSKFSFRVPLPSYTPGWFFLPGMSNGFMKWRATRKLEGTGQEEE